MNNDPIFHEILHGTAARVKKMINEYESYIEERSLFGRTPLIEAVLWNKKEIVAFLLDKRANINAKDNEGKTPLHYACLRENADAVETLLANGADAEISSTSKKETPLLTCVDHGNVDCAKALIAKGVNIYARDPKGQTLLAKAFAVENVELVKLLIQAGADPREQQDPAGQWLDRAAYLVIERKEASAAKTECAKWIVKGLEKAIDRDIDAQEEARRQEDEARSEFERKKAEAQAKKRKSTAKKRASPR